MIGGHQIDVPVTKRLPQALAIVPLRIGGAHLNDVAPSLISAAANVR